MKASLWKAAMGYWLRCSNGYWRLDIAGKKSILGFYLGVEKGEGAKFRLQVLTDLRQGGVEEILITCVDTLKGFPEAIESIYPHTRKIIYTTNKSRPREALEGYHRQVRKITKSKGAFTSEKSLMKLVYLVQLKISEKWTRPIHHWDLAVNQLSIYFGDRINRYLHI